jgi:hypothetical protein
MNVYTTLSLLLIVCIFAVVLIALLYRFLKVRDDSGFDSRTSMRGAQKAIEEKREHSRNDIDWPASIEAPDGTMEAEIKNISLSGAFLCCKKPLPIGEVFRLTMIAPDKEALTATGEVVWSNVNVPDEKIINRGMGVRFINMSDRHIQLVKKIFQESD